MDSISFSAFFPDCSLRTPLRRLRRSKVLLDNVLVKAVVERPSVPLLLRGHRPGQEMLRRGGVQHGEGILAMRKQRNQPDGEAGRVVAGVDFTS